jgi:hypothetical protein
MFFIISGCTSYNDVNETPSVVGAINDEDSWYKDESSEVIEMSVTIPVPNDFLCEPYDDITAPMRPCTLDDINNDLDPIDSYTPKLHIHMQTPTFANNRDLENATFKIKGGYTRLGDQKSYSLKLDSKADLFLAQRKFMLTKSASDRSRLQNKVAFDLFRKIPNITGLQVNFIHLMVDGEDYGLFNQPEAMRKEYLVNRGWNPNDHIYNANNFLFEDSPALALDEDGEPIDPVAFGDILEIKNGNHHQKLHEMLVAIQNTTNIDEVVDKYFDRDNYLTWLAVNLILSDKDAIQHNFYLYNPLYSDKFYFLPWDYDGAWATKKYLNRGEYGISVWWRSALHRKFLSVKKNRDDLYALADKIRADYITDDAIQSITDKYKDLVLPYQLVLPDSEHNSESSWERKTEELVTRIPDNIAMYKEVIGSPMPFDSYASYNKDTSTLDISWGESVDLEGDAIVYDVNVSQGSVDNVIIEAKDIQGLTFSKQIALDSGTYYLRVISKEVDNPQHFQTSYSKIKVDGVHYFGVLEFIVE